MTSRILILGATGMLGHSLMQTLSESAQLDVFGTARSIEKLRTHSPGPILERVTSGVDATNIDAVSQLLVRLRPEVVVNCIGVIRQAPTIDTSTNTIYLNSLFPHLVARECAGIGARLIQFSTDCVFSGRAGSYTEEDIPDPVDFYGRSKLLGEVTATSCLTLRTSFIGHELGTARSLLEWFLSQKTTVRGFRRVIFSGLTTREIGRFLLLTAIPRDDLSGTRHVSSTPISKYELLSMVADEYGWLGEMVPSDEYVCDRSLSSDALSEETGYSAPPWHQMIGEMHQAERRWNSDVQGTSP